MRDILLVLSVFLACIVEGVEALTIVLAVGTTRGWRSTWYGVVSGLLALAIITAVLGPALTAIPINTLRLVIGALLLLFGFQWLRKAILRASGFKALHDETAIFTRQRAAAAAHKANRQKGIISDWYSFTVSFKGVLLEGLEVAFIVVTFGSNQGSVPLAVLGAAAAIVFVVITGFLVRAPLSRIPENTLKFIVGVMLTSFGAFWSGEGAGVRWPGSDAALLPLIATIAVTAIAFIGWLRRIKAQQDKSKPVAGAV
jgi:uncharacterized membrane protein